MAGKNDPFDPPLTSAKTKSPQVKPRKGSKQPSHDQIAARAKAIWQAKGRPPGQDLENWREAEAQLKSEMGLI